MPNPIVVTHTGTLTTARVIGAEVHITTSSYSPAPLQSNASTASVAMNVFNNAPTASVPMNVFNNAPCASVHMVKPAPVPIPSLQSYVTEIGRVKNQAQEEELQLVCKFPMNEAVLKKTFLLDLKDETFFKTVASLDKKAIWETSVVRRVREPLAARLSKAVKSLIEFTPHSVATSSESLYFRFSIKKQDKQPWTEQAISSIAALLSLKIATS
jgi:hypothetical protein